MSEDTTIKIQSMNDLLVQEDQLNILKEGEMIKGKILSVGKNEVYVDVESIGIGVVRGRELYDDEQVLSALKAGDEVYASVVDVENKEGNIELSFRKAGLERVWQSLREKLEGNEIITTKILEANKGGLMVKINNVMGFLPVSQLAPSHYPRVEDGDKNKILAALKGYIDHDFEVKIIAAEQETEKLIVSERAVIEKDLMGKIGDLKVGDEVDGEITGVTDFGAFIKFGDELEGLVHISELAWQRIDDPKDVVKVGQKVKAQVITIDKDRVSLSLKRLQDDPWREVVKKYKIGQKVTGKVLKIAAYGAFVELDDDIHGLAHLGELSDKEINDPSEVLQLGEEQEFWIISIEPLEHRLGLSLKGPTPEQAPVEAKTKDEPVSPDKIEEKAEETSGPDEDKEVQEEKSDN